MVPRDQTSPARLPTILCPVMAARSCWKSSQWTSSFLGPSSEPSHSFTLNWCSLRSETNTFLALISPWTIPWSER